MPADEQTRDYLTRHRFRVTETSRVALDVFRQKLEEFMRLHPEIIGATIFGSHTKGMARTEDDPKGKSDIDTFIFVDDEKYNLDSDPEEIPRVNDDPKQAITGILDKALKYPFNKLFEVVSGYPESEMKDIRFLPLSRTRIDNDLNFLFEKINASNSNVESLFEWTYLPVKFDWTYLSKIFYLQIGVGLDPYRAYILQRLAMLGKVGDRIWDDYFCHGPDGIDDESFKIAKRHSSEEKAILRKRDPLYPHTVADAIKYFHLEGVAPKYEVTTSQR